MADGSIIIDTQIDNDGAVKDLKQLKGTVETAGKSFEKAGNRLSQAFGAKQQSKIETLTQKLERQNESIKKQAVIVDELKAKYDKLASGETEPKQLKSLQSELAKTEKEYQRLLKENDKFLQDYTKAEEMASFDLASNGKIKPENKHNLEISSAGLEETGSRLEELRYKAEKLKEEIKNIKLNPENSEEAKKLGNEFNLAKDKLSRLKDEASVTERNIQKALSVKKQETQKSVKKVNKEMIKTPNIAKDFGKSLERFSNRIKSLVMSALIFNVLSASLRNLTQYMGNVLKTNTDFSNSLAQIKGNLLTAFQPIYEAVMPALNTFMKGVASATAHVAAFFNTLFGKSISQSQKNAQSLYEQANATKKVGKETEKALKPLSNFDEINRLENSKNTSSGSTNNDNSIVPNFDATFDTSDAENFANYIKKFFEPLQRISFNNLSQSIKDLKKSMVPVSKTVLEGWEFGFKHIFVPLTEFTVEDVLPRFLDSLAIAMEGIGFALDNYLDLHKDYVMQFLKPVSEFAGNKFLGFLDNFKSRLQQLVDKVKKSKVFEHLKNIMDKIYPKLVKIVNEITKLFSIIANFKMNSAFDKFETFLSDVEEGLGLISSLIDGDFSKAFEHLKKLFIDNRIEDFKRKIKTLGNAFIEASGMADDCIESVDLFADISTETKEKVEPFVDLVEELDRKVIDIDYQGLIIDQSIVDDIEGKTKKISETIINELDSDKNEALNNLRPLRKALGEEAYNELVQANESYYANMKQKVTDGENRINEIHRNALLENRSVTQEEQNEIRKIEETFYETGILALSDNEIETNAIMNRLKDSTKRISAEQASEIIKNAIKTRDETISAAEMQYSKQELEAARMLNAGKINQEQYDAMIEAAKKTKDETIKEAEEQYTKIYDTANTKLGDLSGCIDENTGEIKSKWQVFCENVGTKWEEGLEKIKKQFNEWKENFKKDWHNGWADIGNFFIGIWNTIVETCEKAINKLVDMLNNFSFTLPDWLDKIPGLKDLAGARIGFDIRRVSFSGALGEKIPKLAQGAVIPPNREFLAVLGDQKSGVNIEAPLETIVEAFRQVQGNENGNTTVIFEIDKREFAKVVYKANKQETQRIGLSFAKGGVY